MPRMPDDMAARYGNLLEEFEASIKVLNDSKSDTLEDLRAELKALGLVGAEISAEIAMLKGAVKVLRMTQVEQQKANDKDEGISDYIAILSLARARAHVRHDADGVVLEDEIPAVVSPAQLNGVNPETPVHAGAVSETADNSSEGTSEEAGGFSVAAAPHDSGATEGDEGDQTSQPESVVGSTDATAGETAPHSTPAAVAPGAAEPGDRSAVIPAAAPVVAETPSVDADAGEDRSEGRAPSSALAPVAKFKTHNPDTHFLSKTGLPRLYGCNKPEACAGSWRNLCFACSVVHDGPPPQGEAVN